MEVGSLCRPGLKELSSQPPEYQRVLELNETISPNVRRRRRREIRRLNIMIYEDIN